MIFLSFLPILPSFTELRNLWPLVEKNAGSEKGVILRRVSPDVSVHGIHSRVRTTPAIELSGSRVRSVATR